MIEKPNLTESEIQENYEEFIDFIKTNTKGPRKTQLLKMYAENALGQEAVVAPASMCEHFHLCHPGGYLQHIMRVIKMSFASKKFFELAGANIDFTDDELIFASMHHDLGKLGDPDLGSYYVNQSEAWKEKKGEFYKMNPTLPYMEVSDRTVFLLQKYGVQYNWKEFLGMKLADGMYNESAEKYLKQFNQDLYLKTNLPRVVHTADYAACRGEYDSWKFAKTDVNI
jgi:hypothetical protein